jgi:hypothetical protein
MRKQNIDDVIMQEHRTGVVVRPKPRGYRIINFNERSPEAAAMNAHLRASAYKSERDGHGRVPRLAGVTSVRHRRISSLLHLRRRYDSQARHNFVRDAILFAVIVALSAWAFLHTVQAIAGQ